MTTAVRFGLVGFGAWGNCHAAAITQTENTQLTAIAAKSEDSCQLARETYTTATVTNDYQELVQRDDVDVVDIVVPSFLILYHLNLQRTQVHAL